jgi:predicted dehydrogenase
MNTEDFRQQGINRRQFLGSSAANAAAAVGMVGVGLAAAAEGTLASNRVRLGMIGVRSQGLELAKTFAGFRDVEIAAVCDVDEKVLASAAEAVESIQKRPARKVGDFRRLLDDKSLDAVVIATPDHWHGPMAVLACAAGKDVYVESPLALTIDEGRLIVGAAKKHSRVVQCGLQQRSGQHFISAVNFVRSGRLGTVRMARAWCVHRRKPIGHKADAPVPSGVDYALWLGPAPQRPFNPNRFHHNWHWYWDYGTGELGNWGVHLLDVARWGLDVELPARISSTGGKHYFNDDRETPDTQIVQFAYPGRTTIVWEHRLWTNHGMEGRSAACAFYGEHGTLIVDRGGWKVYGQKDAPSADASNLLETHCRNFLDSLKTRKTPAADVETAATSSALCHLGNIAHRVGREVAFDAATGCFVRDDAANAFLCYEPRPEWWA